MHLMRHSCQVREGGRAALSRSDGEITVDAIDSTGVRGSYKYAYRGSDVFGSFDVAFCDIHPAGDDFACRW